MDFDPITMGVGAGLSAVSGIGQMITGGIQARRGRRDLKKNEASRPTYSRPDEVLEAGRITRLRASNPFMAGQDLMEQNVRGTTANTVRNVQDMGGVGDMYMAQTNENQALNQIAAQSAQSRLQAEQNLLGQLQLEADYTDKEFDVNKYIPYQERRQDALSRIGAGMQNLFGGMNTIASLGSGFMGLAGKESGFNTGKESPISLSPIDARLDTGDSSSLIMNLQPLVPSAKSLETKPIFPFRLNRQAVPLNPRQIALPPING